MSISPVSQSGAHVLAGSMNGGSGGTHRMRAAVEAVATLFGISPRSLTQAMDGGKSMMDIAAEKGISPMDLLKTIRTAILMAQPSSEERQLSDQQVAKAASRIASHVGTATDHLARTNTSGPSAATGHLDLRA